MLIKLHNIFNKKLGLSKKSQMWISEFTFASVIFLVCLVMFYNVYPVMKYENENTFDDVYIDAKVLAESIDKMGIPNNWTKSDVTRIGLVSLRKNISEDKVEMFRNLSIDNYSLVKSIMGISSDFVIYFLNASDQTIDINGVDIIGRKDIGITGGVLHTNVSNINKNNLVELNRIFLYDKKPIKAVIVTWN